MTVLRQLTWFNFMKLRCFYCQDRKRQSRRTDTEGCWQLSRSICLFVSHKGKVKKQHLFIVRYGGSAHLSFLPADRNEIKRNSERERGRWSRSGVALIEFCADSGQIHLGSSVHLNPDISPEYKTSHAWKAASSVPEIRWSSCRCGSDFFFLLPLFAVEPSHMILCRRRRPVDGESQKRWQICGRFAQWRSFGRWKLSCKMRMFSILSGWLLMQGKRSQGENMCPSTAEKNEC